MPTWALDPRFLPSAPRDLLRPTWRSTTVRALLSLVARARFELWKRWAPNALARAERAEPWRDDLRELTHVVEVLSERSPVVLARLFSRPQVGGALRRAAGGTLESDGSRREPDLGWVPSLCSHAFLALYADGALPGPVVLRAPVPAAIPSLDVRLHVDVAASVVVIAPDRIGGAVVERGWTRASPHGVLDPRGASEEALRRLHAGAHDLGANVVESASLQLLARELVASTGAPRWLPHELGRFVVDVRAPENVARNVAVESARHRLVALSELAELGPSPSHLVTLAERFVATGALDANEREALRAMPLEGPVRGVRDEMLGA